MAQEIFCSVFGAVNRFDCLEGAVLLWAENQNGENYGRFRKELENNQYCLYTEKSENGNIFATYIREDEVINTYFTPCDKKVRAVFESGTGLPPRAEDNKYEAIVAPMVTQVKTGHLKRDCGMSYIIRLCDGRFILIDTPYDEYEETERILEILNEQNTVYEKPVLAACFFTHAHDDHTYAFVRLMKEFADAVVFGDIIYNWPPDGIVPNAVEHDMFDEYVRKIPANIIKARSGQRYCYADAVFDLVYVCDDYYPEKMTDFNSSSAVMRMELDGRRFIWMADAGFYASEIITARYGSESLKSEFLQVAHHGYWGGSETINRLIEPKILLWPVPDFRYRETFNMARNKTIFEKGTVEKIFVSGRYQTTLDLSKPIPEPPKAPEYQKGDIIYSEDFSGKKRIIDLNWEAVTCGSIDFEGAELKLQGGGCLWSTSENGKAMLEVLKQFDLENARSYTLELEGVITKKPDEFDVVYNKPKPAQWQDEVLQGIDVTEGDLKVRLELDAEGKTVRLEYNGVEMFKKEYIPTEPSGLYLMMKAGEIILKKITVAR